MSDIEDAKSALRSCVERVVPSERHAELSRLTAAFVAAVVREERAKAKRQVDAVTGVYRAADTLRRALDPLVPR